MQFSEDNLKESEDSLKEDSLKEDDLKNALRPVDPGPAFTQRVMARVSQLGEAEAKAKAAAAHRKARRFAWLAAPRWLSVRPAWSAAVAALVLVIGLGLGYQQYQRVQQQKERAQVEEARKAKEAERQVMLALRITTEKLNHVFKRVNEPLAPEQPGTRIRRQSL